MAKRVKTSAQKEYEKQLRRIKQFVSRAEKRGYRFSEDIIPSTPQRVTQASVRRLQKITPQTLYKKATAVSERGTVISGTEKRAQERRESAQKAVQTRRANLERVSKPSISFEQAQREIDEATLQRFDTDTYYREGAFRGSILYQGLIDICHTVTYGYPRSNAQVLELLQAEKTKNADELYLRLSEVAPKMVEGLVHDSIRYDVNDIRRQAPYNDLVMLITNRPLTMQESAEYESTREEESSW